KIKDLYDFLVTVNIPFNPKEKGSGAHQHFEKYDRENVRTVAESLSRGVRPHDIGYDWNWGYISLTHPKKKPLEIAREMKRCGLKDAEYLLVYRDPEAGTRVITNVGP